MYLLGLGIILLLLKWLQIGVVGNWSWWWVMMPFAGAALWWTLADLSGLTRWQLARRAQRRAQDRLRRQRDALHTPRRDS